MIIKQGEWDYWLPLLAKAFKFNGAKAVRIIFEDDKAWLTPSTQGHARFELVKGAELLPTRVPTIGPRFRKSKCEITVLDDKDAVIFTNVASDPK